MKIIKIGAIWCTSCILVKNNLDKVLKDNKDIELIEYDIDFDKDQVEKYNIGDKLPVLILEKDEHEITRLIGEATKDEIKKMIEGSR